MPKEVILYSDLMTLDDFSVNYLNQRPKEVIPYSDFLMEQQFSLSDHANLYTFSDDAGNLKSSGFGKNDKLTTNLSSWLIKIQDLKALCSLLSVLFSPFC